ncbi:MAG: hypothetical protein ABJQ18_02640 [Parasphingorhabdus sp.]|uniref:tetratricopeptide repeat protein n=1 Tax=Parasphingorhabdus sp. TaxID=2709688 RepID=UPI00329A6878
MFTPLLLIAVQSVTPFGSPAPEILQPRKRQDPVEQRFNKCIDLAVDDPQAGLTEANTWLIEGGGFLARHCLGFANAEQFNWAAATKAFVASAQAAEVARDKRIDKFWAQAGNAALAGGDAVKALEYLNAALVQGSLKGLAKGLVHLDRARAHVALEDYPAAKAEFAMVHQLAPEDPLGWLLSATLARRMGDLELARNDILVADQRAPGDPAIALEAGNIAFESGDKINAKANWGKAVQIDAESQSAKIAQKYLSQLVTKVEE